MLSDLEAYFDCKIEFIFSRKRKTTSIQINPNGIKVSSNYWSSEFAIKKFIIKNEVWIKKKLSEQKLKVRPKLNLINNQKITLNGEKFYLKINSHLISKPELKSYSLIVSDHDNVLKKFGSLNDQLKFILKDHSYNLLYEKTKYFSKIMGVNPISIKVKNYKSRWGSCSSKGDISYNWKIIFAPTKIINYLIIHELSHLIFFNHSKEFWMKVREYQPEFKLNRRWLKDNSYKLDL